jgi:hypothetical protein
VVPTPDSCKRNCLAELTTGKGPLAHFMGHEARVASILELDHAILFL